MDLRIENAKQLVFTLLLIALSPVAWAVGAALAGYDVGGLLRDAPVEAIALAAGVLAIGWIAAIWAFIHSRETVEPHVFAESVPQMGWQEHQRVQHAGVEWILQRNRTETRHLRQVIRGPPSFRVDPNPACPACHARLRQRGRTLGGWQWTCPQGDFKRNSNASFRRVAGDVGRIHRDRVLAASETEDDGKDWSFGI